MKNATIGLLAVLMLCSFTSAAAPPAPTRDVLSGKLKDASARFDRIVFIKRFTYTANHYYSEYKNGAWLPGGGICVLSLRDGSTREIATGLKGGVFGRFDLSFDAKKIVFDWKKAQGEGYRIYEINVNGTGLRQLTFPQADEKQLVAKYKNAKLPRVYLGYHHGTDDMHPCYLPDGGIAFISTRCQYGTLCGAWGNFTTTVLYRMDGDGKNIRKLTNSSVSEAYPAVTSDGRIMYTRWEYVNKGAVSAKCLWAMKPDGSASVEIYGNDISLPPSFIQGRPIPGSPGKFVFLGAPHCPQAGIGTVIRLDMTKSKSIRTREPMTYITPDVDIRSEGGFAFRQGNGRWRRDSSGRSGRLFRDPWPLSEKLFLVSHKPAGTAWTDPKSYGLYLLDDSGKTELIYNDANISCWQPIPLKPRKRPRVLSSDFDPKTAAKGLATCVVTDVYHGMENTPRGTVKYLRILEQVPRPWASRRFWHEGEQVRGAGSDAYDQQHSVITKKTHLGLKVQHGIVPVEEDGSAHFLVPAEKNVYFQALDANYMSVQTERTYVNYMPGETRSCIGCHETPNDAASGAKSVVKALKRPPSAPGPQPGDKSAARPLYYPTDVQPVLDKHCIKCHGAGKEKPKAGLDLRGTPTKYFSNSYERLLNRKYLPLIGENHPKTGNVGYLPARSLGSHNSLLAAMLSKGKVKLKDPERAKLAAKLAEKHKDLKLKPHELLKITNWIDTNGQFYGMYWGRKNLAHKDHPNFRPVPTFKRAVSTKSLIPEEQR
ncbi:MAG: hypothetical protein QGH60_07370 [Phycisphaerae bacterium]|nr:hypothetical protein [Phycisphaerae bacterium]